MIDKGRKVASFLAKELKAESILLYGSYAQNLQDEKSDFDFLIICKRIPSLISRKRVYEKIETCQILELSNEKMAIKNGWDQSWSPVNDKLLIQNTRFEIGYNTVAWVKKVVDQLIVKNKTSFPEFPFRPYTFLGLLESSLLLYDKGHFIKHIQEKIRPIPVGLKKAVLQEFLPILIESREELVDYSERNIGVLGFQFHLFRGIDALIQVLFALNDVYDPATKRVEPLLLKLKKKPPKLKEFIFKILPRFYEEQAEICQFFKKAIAFVAKNLNV